MFLRLLRAKLHQATVTRANLHYVGSITIDEAILEAVGLLPHEIVTVANIATGQRGETYIIRGERGSGAVELNGAMARLASVGDRLIVLAFAFLQPDEVNGFQASIATLDEKNHILRTWKDAG